ncbi:MAG: hypothetical protein AVDCRST_MAG93-8615 [uncultured Chloroflexia bacterium]|uniref:Uncharacterized protein n=1 Tax=uncultured Chloroflexia bacterium TaxID=1672391 RepID=A0A6J4MZL2_9CHLR|nr:MAG: hypothetical protein AVDCRST_MAG93-8615 [uncultured Chloroflexia bacterium]
MLDQPAMTLLYQKFDEIKSIVSDHVQDGGMSKAATRSMIAWVNETQQFIEACFEEDSPEEPPNPANVTRLNTYPRFDPKDDRNYPGFPNEEDIIAPPPVDPRIKTERARIEHALELEQNTLEDCRHRKTQITQELDILAAQIALCKAKITRFKRLAKELDAQASTDAPST